MIWSFNYDSPQAIKSLLEANGMAMNRKFGQNFLIDRSARERLCALVGPAPGKRLWEIGPGAGSLTVKLLEGGASVVAFEIDHGFCRILRGQAFVSEPGLELVEGDFLKTWAGVYGRQGAPDALFSNLPYNIGALCVARLLEEGCLPKRMVFTHQTEVARRLASPSGSRERSGLALLIKADYDASISFSLPGSCFYPPPAVSSSVVVLEKRPQGLVPDDLRPAFARTLRLVFARRRKTLRNNLAAIPGAGEALAAAGIDGGLRAEALDLPSLAVLARELDAAGLLGGGRGN